MNTDIHVLHAHRVLVVDNNHDYADAVGELLRMTCDWDGEVAYGPVDALSRAFAHPPDAVLLDLEMPEMNGFDTADLLIEAMKVKRPRLVAVTGNSNLQIRASHDGRFADALLKPADNADLLVLLAGFAASPCVQ
jgi:CheY-like chemotaxis protein